MAFFSAAVTGLLRRSLPFSGNFVNKSRNSALIYFRAKNYCSKVSAHSKFSTPAPCDPSKVSKNLRMSGLSPMDPASYSRPDEVVTNHISLKLKVDFEKKVLSGEALYSFEIKQDIDSIVLDVRDLNIKSITLEDGSPLCYTITDTLHDFGSKLTIKLCNLNCLKENGLKVRIVYTTSPEASALQWLEPNQTVGKIHPYLFSQCQPIHARSIVPCQDTPAVKFTYDAQVTAPKAFSVLMSALHEESSEGVACFRQPVPIPAYLLAIAVGVLESRKLGPRSTVWSEKEVVESAAWEFALTEQYLQTAERICGPYVWGQYDLLVLPPSFPYGGMENPCLTFVTPCLLTGDRSQAEVIVHEIMHSWSGNLVTNRTFEHFWLNEGFTVFLERKVGAALVEDPNEAKKSRDFQSLLGLQELTEAIKHLSENNPLTRLELNLKGVHPDDAFSRVPYEKGSLFLRFLEDTVGGPAKFDDFLRSYINTFANKTVVSSDFQEFFTSYFKNTDAIKSIDWDRWLRTPGMPPIIPDYDMSMAKVIREFLTNFTTTEMTASEIATQTSSFTPHQIVHMLQELIDLPPISLPQLNELTTALNLRQSQNSELLYRYYRLCARSKDQDKLQEILDYLNSQGRMKYVRPLYRDLYAWEEVRERTIENFLNNEKNMMFVSAFTVKKDLHLNQEAVVN